MPNRKPLAGFGSAEKLCRSFRSVDFEHWSIAMVNALVYKRPDTRIRLHPTSLLIFITVVV